MPEITTPDRFTFRDTIRKVTPSWLRTGRAYAFLYALMIQLDALIVWCREAIRIRFPNVYTFETLSWAGEDRKIPRGPQETDAQYATRLRSWRDAHRRRGNAYVLLEQIHEYFKPLTFQAKVRTRNGVEYTKDAAGVITRGTAAWTADASAASKWARYHVILSWPNAIGDDGIWSDPGTWDDGGVWDYDLTILDVEHFVRLARDWRPGHVSNIYVTAESSGVDAELVALHVVE